MNTEVILEWSRLQSSPISLLSIISSLGTTALAGALDIWPVTGVGSEEVPPEPDQVLGADSDQVLGADSDQVLGADSDQVLGADSDQVLGASPDQVLGANPDEALGAGPDQVLGAVDTLLDQLLLLGAVVTLGLWVL